MYLKIYNCSRLESQCHQEVTRKLSASNFSYYALLRVYFSPFSGEYKIVEENEKSPMDISEAHLEVVYVPKSGDAVKLLVYQV